MKTPLASALFFVNHIQSLLADSPSQQLLEIAKYLNLIVIQLTLMQSFVDDMLDLRMIKDGVFTLVEEAFDVN